MYILFSDFILKIRKNRIGLQSRS